MGEKTGSSRGRRREKEHDLLGEGEGGKMEKGWEGSIWEKIEGLKGQDGRGSSLGKGSRKGLGKDRIY